MLHAKLDDVKNQHHKILQENDGLNNIISTLKKEILVSQKATNDTKVNLDEKVSESTILQERVDGKKSEIKVLTRQLHNNQNNLEHYREITRQERESERKKYEAQIDSLNKELQKQQELNAVNGDAKLHLNGESIYHVSNH
jgi:chromosome segregation ATPase